MHKQHLLIGRCKLHQREKKALLHMICTSSPFAVRVSASSPIEAERKIKWATKIWDTFYFLNISEVYVDEVHLLKDIIIIRATYIIQKIYLAHIRFRETEETKSVLNCCGPLYIYSFSNSSINKEIRLHIDFFRYIFDSNIGTATIYSTNFLLTVSILLNVNQLHRSNKECEAIGLPLYIMLSLFMFVAGTKFKDLQPCIKEKNSRVLCAHTPL
jgi:hypothetical protein